MNVIKFTKYLYFELLDATFTCTFSIDYNYNFLYKKKQDITQYLHKQDPNFEDIGNRYYICG